MWLSASCYSRGQQTFSETGKILNIFSFVSRRVFVQKFHSESIDKARIRHNDWGRLCSRRFWISYSFHMWWNVLICFWMLKNVKQNSWNLQAIVGQRLLCNFLVLFSVTHSSTFIQVTGIREASFYLLCDFLGMSTAHVFVHSSCKDI